MPAAPASAAAEPPAARRPAARVATSPAEMTGGVRIEPAGGTAYQNRPQTFTIWNTGATTATYTITTPCDGGVTGCTASVSSVTLAPTASAQVTVTYVLNSPGTVRLTASSGGETASGWVAVGSLPTGFVPQNYFAVPIRHLCVTLALPGQAASECGDLRLAHALPTVRTMNRARTPVLLYNSALAQPRMRLIVNYTANPSAPPVDSVAVAAIMPDGTRLPQQRWSGWNSQTETRRVVYSVDASGINTGLYNVTLERTSWRAGVPTVTTAQTGYPVVNRSASRFGAGWWLAGLEQLQHLADGRKLWVSGDGSIGIYFPLTDSTWVAWNTERPDTLKKRVNGTDTTFVRLLPGGTRVVFDGSGRHSSTVTRAGQVTAFAYGANGLATITVPGGAVYTFEYGATARPRLWRVRLNRDTVQRAVSFDQDADPRIRNISDPDGGLTTLVYPCCDTTHKQVIQRMDPRRRSWATFTYDAIGKVTRGELDMGTPGTLDDIVVRITPGESRGAAPVAVPFDSAYTLVDGPRADSDVRDVTRFWLPPTLDTSVPQRIVDALGNETVITYGDARFQNLATRVDGPVMADGTRQTTYATHDARGNVTSTVLKNPLGDGRDATTRYDRGDVRWPDFVTQVTQPMGEKLYFGYDAAGNRQYQQDGRGAASTVYFGYNAQGQVAWTQDQVGAFSRMEYDAAGNLNAIYTPRGYVSLSYADALGRDTLSITPTDSVSGRTVSGVRASGTRVRTQYDPMGRPTLVATIGQPRSEVVNGDALTVLQAPAETLYVSTGYTAGQPDSVSRWARPDTAHTGTLTRRWTYDAAGRTLTEMAEDGNSEAFVYDPAGNVTQRTTRRGHNIRMRYDALGRLTSRRDTAVTYGTSVVPVANETWRFPRYVDDGTGRLDALNSGNGSLVLPAQLDTFTYDAVGNLATAINADAQVLREYYPGGALKTETQRIANYVRGGGWHQYVLAYEYDLNGRRTRLHHPVGLGSGDPAYQYDPVTGELKTISAHSGTFAYDYTLAGQLRQLTRTTPEGLQAYEQWTYDGDGQVRRRRDLANADTLHSDSLIYDARGKVLESQSQWRDRSSNRYSGIGSLLWSRTDRPGAGTRTEETYVMDALGNRESMRLYVYSYRDFHVDVNPNERRGYQYAFGRMVRDSSVIDGSSYTYAASTPHYDAAGNQTDVSSDRPVSVIYSDPHNLEHTEGSTATLKERTRQYYDAQDRLRVADRQTCLVYYNVCDHARPPYYDARPAFEEYRYDALGRRVLVRSRADTLCPQQCRNTVQRTIWDGDQVLMEISAPGATGTPTAQMEADTGLARYSQFNRRQFFYGRVAYVHGHGIDEPLAIVRFEYSDSIAAPIMLLPHANSRGGVDTATYQSPCITYTPVLTRIDDTTATVGMPKTQMHCLEAPYPQRYELASHENVAQDRFGPISWMGSLITGSRDATGQHYMRNRYYDPKTGRFTQEDPIGLAGGVNVYGFAAGDPVNYSDPYGLSPDSVKYSTHAVKQAVDEAASHSPEIAAAIEVLDRDPHVIVQFTEAAPGALGVDNPGQTTATYLANGNVYIEVRFDWTQIAHMHAQPQYRDHGDINRDVVVGHEVVSHAFPFGWHWRCLDLGGCAAERENRLVRPELHMDPRTF